MEKIRETKKPSLECWERLMKGLDSVCQYLSTKLWSLSCRFLPIEKRKLLLLLPYSLKKAESICYHRIFFFVIVFDNGDVVSVVISYFSFVVILMINQACMPMTSASQVPEEKEAKWWKSEAQFWLKREVGPIIHKNVITVHDVNEALQEICFVLYLFWSSLYLEFETLLKILVLDAWKKNARSKLKIWGKLQTLFICL